MKHVVVVGANFAGATAALEIKRRLKKQVDVTVIDTTEHFLYFPSLVWVPIRRREIDEILIPRRPVFHRRGVHFVVDTAVSVDPEQQRVTTERGVYVYDQLVIATGPKVDHDIAPGVHENSCYIGSIQGALQTREKLDEFKHSPGPIVIGATQKASCMGAAYEFLFNVEKWLREQRIRKKVDLYWITPEPYLGHFGIYGMPLGEFYLRTFMRTFRIHYRTGVGVQNVSPDSVTLDTGETIASRFTMLMVPFTGVDFVANSPEIDTLQNHFLDVDSSYRHKKYHNIWGAGLAVNVPPRYRQGREAFGVPKTGYPSDRTGKIVAENIAKTLRGRGKLKREPWGKIAALCVMDAGKKEVLIFGNHLFKPRQFAVMIPNICNDWSKLLLEKYFLWKLRHGYSRLP